jgi:hypothetical protein
MYVMHVLLILYDEFYIFRIYKINTYMPPELLQSVVSLLLVKLGLFLQKLTIVDIYPQQNNIPSYNRGH